MKKLLLFILLFILVYTGSISKISAQPYTPMAVEGAHWIIVLHDEQTVIPVDGLWEYYCNGDTIINNTDYKIIYKRDLEVTQSGPPFTGISPYQLAGFIRDDTTARKVYSIDWVTDFFDNCPNGEEYLLFDFSLEVGDSTDMCLYPIIQHEIMSIQYVHLFNQEVKAFFTNTDSFYEGIGSDYGLFEEMILVEFYSTSLDFYCPDSPCEYLVSARDIVIPEYFKIYPNPASDNINLRFDPRENWQNIHIRNNLGTLIASYYIPEGSGDLTINIEGLSSGVYFCGLTSKNKRSPLNKLVVIK